MPLGQYTEDHLVEQPAIQLFVGLGWTAVSAMGEVFGLPSPQPLSQGERGISLGRETKSGVVLAPRLREILERLNAALTPEAITVAFDTIACGLLLPRIFSGADVAGGIGLE
jgi:type I restriction enzyme R subunit